MSPRSFSEPSSDSAQAALRRLWLGVGIQIRDARRGRRWTMDMFADRAGVSRGSVFLVESGGAISVEMDEPYQHYQFAGRADVISWDESVPALLHIENRTRFPDFQEMAGSFNSKRAYLGAAGAKRLGIQRWASETHVIVALWSAEVLHSLRMRPESFRSLSPDPPDAFASWWAGQPPSTGVSSSLVLLDPLASGRQRAFIGLDESIATAKPRHRGYAEVVAKMAAQQAGG